MIIVVILEKRAINFFPNPGRVPVSMMVLRIPIRTISFDLFATFCGSSPTWSFLICYSCSFYSSMIEVKEELAKKPVNYDGKIKAYQFEPEMCNTCF